MRHLFAPGLFLFLAGCAGAGFGRYEKYVVVDPPPAPASGVKVTYLGVTGYLLQSRDATVLVDPYFSRIGLLYALPGLNRLLPVTPNRDRLEWALKRLPRKADLVLVGHGHIDHLFDAPDIAIATGAELIASPSSCRLARAAAGCRELRTLEISLEPGELGKKVRRGAVTVRGVGITHEPMFGKVHNDQPVPEHPHPRTESDWRCGESLAFLVGMGGKKIYLSSGSPQVPPAGVGPVDLAILGVALRETRERFARTVKALRPRYVIPSHQDDIFRAPEKGFRFGPTSKFDEVLKQHRQTPRVKLIQLDYFQPWTLH